MALTDMSVYNTEIQENTVELLAQKTELFNQASGGAIALTSVGNEGDFDKAAFWSNLAGAIRRVDRYAVNAVAPPTSLSQGEIVGVKVAGGFGPVELEPAQLTWLQRSPGEAITAISNSFSDALMADQLNTSIMSAVAAIENQPNLVNDVSASASISQSALNGAHAKFGDASQMLITSVMTGAAYHKLIGQAIDNNNRLFAAGNVQVVEILGKLVVVSDIPALYEAGAPNKDKILSLVSGGVRVSDSNDLITNMETTNGNERIETTWQADYTFQVGLTGFAWDTVNGGPSPNDAELATGTNWDKAVSQDKNLAGVLCVGDADL